MIRNHIITLLCLWAFSMSFGWFIFGYAVMEPNPLEWAKNTRIGVCFFTVVSFFLSLSGTLAIEEMEQKKAKKTDRS